MVNVSETVTQLASEALSQALENKVQNLLECYRKFFSVHLRLIDTMEKPKSPPSYRWYRIIGYAQKAMLVIKRLENVC